MRPFQEEESLKRAVTLRHHGRWRQQPANFTRPTLTATNYLDSSPGGFRSRGGVCNTMLFFCIGVSFTSSHTTIFGPNHRARSRAVTSPLQCLKGVRSAHSDHSGLNFSWDQLSRALAVYCPSQALGSKSRLGWSHYSNLFKLTTLTRCATTRVCILDLHQIDLPCDTRYEASADVLPH